MKNTPNYNLNKPDGNDYAKIESLNENADIIDTELKKRETALTNVTAQLEQMKPKVDNSWQKGQYNNTDVTNLGSRSASKTIVINTDDWKSLANVEAVYISIPTTSFCGIVKVTYISDFANSDAGVGAVVEYHIHAYSNAIHKQQKMIQSISPQFAKYFLIGDVFFGDGQVYIMLYKGSQSKNPVSIKVDVNNSFPIFDAVKNIGFTILDTNSPTSYEYPWTPQKSAIDSKFYQNTTRANGVDLNTYKTNGVFALGDGLVNGVTPSHYGAYSTLYVSTSADVVTQLLIDYLGNIYTRSFSSGIGGWGLWRRLLTQDDYDALFTSVSSGKTKIASATSDMGVPTSPDATFDQMAANIRAIYTGYKSAKGTAYATNESVTVSGLGFTPSIVIIKSIDNQVNVGVRFAVMVNPSWFSSSALGGIMSYVGFIADGSRATYWVNNGSFHSNGFTSNVNDERYKNGNVSWLAIGL